MKNNEKTLEMKEKIINELTRIKNQNSSSGFVIDDLIERINKASNKRNSLSEYCTLLMNGTMTLGMFGQIKKDDFTAIQNLNKECAELAQKDSKKKYDKKSNRNNNDYYRYCLGSTGALDITYARRR